MWPRRQHSEPI